MKVRSVARRCAVATAWPGCRHDGDPAVLADGTAGCGGRSPGRRARRASRRRPRVRACPDGLVRGFLETGCQGDSIDYVSDDPAHPPGCARRLPTPYKGLVLATAQDATGDLPALPRDRRRADHQGAARRALRRAATCCPRRPAVGSRARVAAAGGGVDARSGPSPRPPAASRLHAAASAQLRRSRPRPGSSPAGAGVDDSAPVLARTATEHNYLLAFAPAHGQRLPPDGRATAASPWAAVRELDSGTENPQPASPGPAVNTYLAWIHGSSVRLATTIGGTLARSAAAPGRGAAGDRTAARSAHPQVGVRLRPALRRLQAEGRENSGDRLGRQLSQAARWSGTLVRLDRRAAPVLAGIAPHCASGARALDRGRPAVRGVKVA